MARLQPEEGDGVGRRHGDAAHGAGLAVEPRGDVDRQRPAAGGDEGVDVADAARREAVDVARKPGAIERVDDEIGAAERERLRRRDLAAPARRHFRRVVAQRVAGAEQMHRGRIAPGGR